MTCEEAHALILGFPGVTEGTAWNHPAYRVAGKFLTRLREEDDSLVLLGIGFDEREMLMEADPTVFHLTDHYRNHPCVLARIGPLDAAALKAMIERRWRAQAPKAMVKAYDAG